MPNLAYYDAISELGAQKPEQGQLVDLEHPIAGAVKAVGIPVKMSATPGKVRFPAPLLGQHTREVLQNLLHYDLKTVQELEKEGVI